ncbi:MAG TPA: DNA gyrase inhibitor YacG [Candidatus Acidoferrales bacterium]|nr:DNA gyrase inhibitor YacG [Candidatus Acidoferrales bacterium]
MKYRCPICKKQTDSDVDKDFPFCSERCRLTDLGNWATEKYKVSEPAADESEREDQPPRRGEFEENHE